MTNQIVPRGPEGALVPALPAGAHLPGDAVPADLARRVRRPIVAGCVVIGVFVVGTFAWAATAKLAGAVVSPGLIRVESSRKTIKHRDGGVVREILVKEGDTVRTGEVMIRMDDTTPRAQVDVLAATLDNLLMQRARLHAERDGRAAIEIPKELQARIEEPVIATLVRDQNNLFETRKSALDGQFDVLKKRLDQSKTRIEGLDATVASLDKQSALIDDELEGVESLYKKALVPKTRVRALERSAAELLGNKGAQISEIARTKELMSETELQMTLIVQQRNAEVADSLREVQAKIADTLPRLRATEDTLRLVEVKAPEDGYVLNLTQFTKNGVVTPGERLLDLVPTDAPLVVEARLKPDEAYEVRPGMQAHIQLATYESRQLPPIPATVTKVSADRLQDPRTGEPYFVSDLSIAPDALKELVTHVRLYPGMSATAMIGTGERTVLDYITAPVRDSLRGALRER